MTQRRLSSIQVDTVCNAAPTIDTLKKFMIRPADPHRFALNPSKK